MNKRAFKIAVAALATIAAAGVFTFAEEAGPLDDRIDAAILSGKIFPGAFLGAPTSKYRVFAVLGGQLTPIPFQVDERNKDGILVVTSGLKITPDTDNGNFDANDEVVFMAFDAGAKFSGAPAIAGCESFAEIALKDGKTGAAGYAYLGKCTNPPAASQKKYVAWDSAKTMATGKNYVMGWQQPGQKFYYDYLSSFGGPDILDRLKIRIAVGFKSMHFVFDEDNFENNRHGMAIGPVRIADVNLANLKLGPIGKIPVHQFISWYRDYIFLNNRLTGDVNPAAFGLDYQVRIIHDLALDRSRGYKICTNVASNCIAITGTMTPEMNEMAKKELEWGGPLGPEGSLITQIVMEKKLHTRSMGWYLDKDTEKNKPESIPGSSPEMGYYVVDWKNAEKGWGSIDFYHFALKKFSVPEVTRCMRITKQPLQASVTAM